MALSGLEKNEEALGALERAIRINPDYPNAEKARASLNSKLGINFDEDEEEKMEADKPKVKKSVWTRKIPTSEIMKKTPGQGRDKRVKSSGKSVRVGKERKTGKSKKIADRGREKKK